MGFKSSLSEVFNRCMYSDVAGLALPLPSRTSGPLSPRVLVFVLGLYDKFQDFSSRDVDDGVTLSGKLQDLSTLGGRLLYVVGNYRRLDRAWYPITSFSSSVLKGINRPVW